MMFKKQREGILVVKDVIFTGGPAFVFVLVLVLVLVFALAFAISSARFFPKYQHIAEKRCSEHGGPWSAHPRGTRQSSCGYP
jgi:hypothetical protein